MSATSESSTSHLELRILTNHVGSYPQRPSQTTSDDLASSAMTAGPPIPTPPSHFTRLLSGPLAGFLRHSGGEQSKWLIDIAHDICDPALKRGILRVLDADGEMWNDVNPTDPLTAAIYLYDVQAVISLTKISKRQNRSKTTANGNPSTMANRVMQRDEHQCWVTGTTFSLINSHICPKRMGDHLLRTIYRTFVSTPPPALSIYDEECGITLTGHLDGYFDEYELGLRFVAQDEYECHAFFLRDEPYDWGLGTVMSALNLPPLHGFRASPPQRQDARNPPSGLIRWHYLQCVIRRFAHTDYKNMPNIQYYELPIRMEGDSDDEGADREFDWPSAALDRGRAMQIAIEDNEER